jgi:hypothetical protein
MAITARDELKHLIATGTDHGEWLSLESASCTSGCYWGYGLTEML